MEGGEVDGGGDGEGLADDVEIGKTANGLLNVTEIMRALRVNISMSRHGAGLEEGGEDDEDETDVGAETLGRSPISMYNVSPETMERTGRDRSSSQSSLYKPVRSNTIFTASGAMTTDEDGDDSDGEDEERTDEI